MLPDLTNAERMAVEATRLESFPVNLQEIRRTLELLLKEFGRYSFFDEFTTHSYDHIHELLKCVDWLIPESTKPLLTKADWWLITLSCYFHDLGLVITRSEYEGRPQPKRDRLGEIQQDLQSDTIEVYADFKRAEGFFGLTSYLQYAEKELQASFSLIEKSRRDSPRKLGFPWRYINDNHIRTEGFLPQRYEFKLDQSRILDLLTGHTLYNNSAIAVRELTQNAIDAVRLKAFERKERPETSGVVRITWNSHQSELTIQDNGTGMTQEIIENHLLKVGSSRYQDKKFMDEHPGFSPISRFGIGVLSAFMVADTVEILTCSESEDEARQISLRSVHGKYLIRLIRKTDPEAHQVAPHGTKIVLKLRATAAKVDVLNEVRRWIVVPRCSVVVMKDDEEPVTVGYQSTKEALEQSIAKYADALIGNGRYRVEERNVRGLSLAYVLVLDPGLGVWSFASIHESSTRLSDEQPPLFGTCVEGIAVEFRPPGFGEMNGVIAIANATGEGAPKTNVARSSLENTAENREITRSIYHLYSAEIEAESRRLISEQQFSLSRAISEMSYLAYLFRSPRIRLAEPDLLRQEMAKLPTFLAEGQNERSAASLGDLERQGVFWSIVSPLNWSIEYLIKEMPVPITARQLFKLADDRVPNVPDGLIVTNLAATSMPLEIVEQKFEVKKIRAFESDRWVDLEWRIEDGERTWVNSASHSDRLQRANYRLWNAIHHYFREENRAEYRQFYYSREHGPDVMFPVGDVSFVGLEQFGAVRVFGRAYLVSGNPINQYLLLLLNGNIGELSSGLLYLNILTQALFLSQGELDQALLDRYLREFRARDWDEYLQDWTNFCDILLSSRLKMFDPFAASRDNVGSN